MTNCPFLNDVAKFDQVVCENVLWMFDDAEEIGSSDINACVNAIIDDFGVERSEVLDNQFYTIRIAVRQAIMNMAAIRANY